MENNVWNCIQDVMKSSFVDDVNEELESKGCAATVEEITVDKNSVQVAALRVIIPGNDISPIIYPSSSETVDEVADKVESAINAEAPDFDFDKLFDAEFIKKNLFITVQKATDKDEDYVKGRFLNLDFVPRILVEGNFKNENIASAKITDAVLKKSGLLRTDVLSQAFSNSEKTAEIKGMSEMLGFGFSFSQGEFMWVARCNNGIGGASVLGMERVFKEFCEKHDFDHVYMLPSSTEEVIVIKDLPDDSVEVAQNMVNDINGEMVSPEIQLTPTVYKYDLKQNLIDIVQE